MPVAASLVFPGLPQRGEIQATKNCVKSHSFRKKYAK
jgi:hypothetical protein